MVVYNREITNINSFLDFSAMSNPVEANYILKDVNIDKLRGRFIISSKVMLRVMLAHSDILFILYVKRIKAQSSNPFWFNQTKQKNFQLSYVSPKRGKIHLTKTRLMVPLTYLVYMLKVRYP